MRLLFRCCPESPPTHPSTMTPLDALRLQIKQSRLFSLHVDHGKLVANETPMQDSEIPAILAYVTDYIKSQRLGRDLQLDATKTGSLENRLAQLTELNSALENLQSLAKSHLKTKSDAENLQSLTAYKTTLEGQVTTTKRDLAISILNRYGYTRANCSESLFGTLVNNLARTPEHEKLLSYTPCAFNTFIIRYLVDKHGEEAADVFNEYIENPETTRIIEAQNLQIYLAQDPLFKENFILDIMSNIIPQHCGALPPLDILTAFAEELRKADRAQLFIIFRDLQESRMRFTEVFKDRLLANFPHQHEEIHFFFENYIPKEESSPFPMAGLDAFRKNLIEKEAQLRSNHFLLLGSITSNQYQLLTKHFPRDLARFEAGTTLLTAEILKELLQGCPK